MVPLSLPENKMEMILPSDISELIFQLHLQMLKQLKMEHNTI
jgi:hypothetical protein